MQAVTKNFVSCNHIIYQENKERQTNLKNNKRCTG